MGHGFNSKLLVIARGHLAHRFNPHVGSTLAALSETHDALLCKKWVSSMKHHQPTPSISGFITVEQLSNLKSLVNSSPAWFSPSHSPDSSDTKLHEVIRFTHLIWLYMAMDQSLVCFASHQIDW